MFLKITLILLIISVILYYILKISISNMSISKQIDIALKQDTYPILILIGFVIFLLTTISTIVFLIITIIKW